MKNRIKRTDINLKFTLNDCLNCYHAFRESPALSYGGYMKNTNMVMVRCGEIYSTAMEFIAASSQSLNGYRKAHEIIVGSKAFWSRERETYTALYEKDRTRKKNTREMREVLLAIDRVEDLLQAYDMQITALIESRISERNSDVESDIEKIKAKLKDSGYWKPIDIDAETVARWKKEFANTDSFRMRYLAVAGINEEIVTYVKRLAKDLAQVDTVADLNECECKIANSILRLQNSWKDMVVVRHLLRSSVSNSDSNDRKVN